MNIYEAGGFFVRSLNRRKSFGHCLFRLISPPMKYPPQAVMDGSSPCTPEPGDFSRGFRPASAENDPLDHFPGASALLDLIKRQTCRRCASGPAAESRQPGCKASGESQRIIPGRKASFPPGIFLAFYWPEASCPDPNAAGGDCWLFQQRYFAWWGAGDHPLPQGLGAAEAPASGKDKRRRLQASLRRGLFCGDAIT